MNDVIEQLKKLPTTALSDALKGMTNISPSIKPLNDSDKIVGKAFPVQTAVGDNLAVLQAIKEAKKGDIIVVDVKGDTYRAIAGDFVIAMMQTMEIGGLLVDGAVRDVTDIKKLQFPVFVRDTTTASGTKNGPGQINIPISCGGTTIQPGDYIVGDIDGIVVIPPSKIEDVIQTAKNKMDNDDERERKIVGNKEAVINYINDMIAKSK